MKIILNFILLSLFGLFIFPELYAALAFGLTFSLAVHIFLNSNQSFMFREWALFLYASNYLLSPAITYQLSSEQIMYAMKINSDSYFNLAFPGFLFFSIGMFIIPNNLFKPDLKKVNQASMVNERFLLQTTVVGIFLSLFSDLFPGEIGFFIYLLAMVRFVGAFSLFATNSKKYIGLAILVLLIELFFGFRAGMYHDAIMWVLFFALFYVYISKPTLRVKIIGGFCLITLVLFIQAIKYTYRKQVWEGGKEASIETLSLIHISEPTRPCH
jgi:hypothetical protein